MLAYIGFIPEKTIKATANNANNKIFPKCLCFYFIFPPFFQSLTWHNMGIKNMIYQLESIVIVKIIFIQHNN